MSLAKQKDFTLIKASRLIDGTGAATVERGAVLMENGSIKSVGSDQSVKAPEGAEVLEIVYEEHTILPGLVDCHVHLNGMGDGRDGDDLVNLPDEVLSLQSARNARAHLACGVTTLRDCGAKQTTTFKLRQSIELGIAVGPRLVLTGRPMAIIGGHLSYFGIESTGADQCRAAVRQLIKEGADFVKITATGGSTKTSVPLRPSFNLEELTAICDEAHKFGKHTAAHCVSSEAMLNCLKAGIDTIIHARHREPNGKWLYREDIVERILNQDVMVNCNLGGGSVNRRLMEERKTLFGLTASEQLALDEMTKERESYVDAVSRMRADGVSLACGSDSAWGNYKMGLFHEEVSAHVEAGMSHMEAIISATSTSAKSCWIDDKVGTLEPGKIGDILIVKGDPVKDINVLSSPVAVYQSGVHVEL